MKQFALRILPLALLVIGLVACGSPQVTGVVSVEIAGGDRQVPLDTTMVLGANVVAGAGTSTAVTWASSDESVAAIDGQGVLTALTPGETTVTATSTVDTSLSDSIVVTVVVDQSAAREFAATYVPLEEEPPVLGVGFAIADPSVMPTSFTDLGNGVFLGPLAPVGPEGAVAVTLPAPSDVPTDALTGADDLFGAYLEEAPDCALEAGDPTVQVTPLVLSFITFPGVILSTVDGIAPAALTDSPTNPISGPEGPSESTDLFTYLYADGPTSIATTGTDCSTPLILAPVTFDLELKEGWNLVRIALAFEGEAPESVTITNGAAEQLFVHPVGII